MQVHGWHVTGLRRPIHPFRQQRLRSGAAVPAPADLGATAVTDVGTLGPMKVGHIEHDDRIRFF